MGKVLWTTYLIILTTLLFPKVLPADEAMLLTRMATLENQIEVFRKEMTLIKAQLTVRHEDLAEIRTQLPQETKAVKQAVEQAWPWLEGLHMKGDLRLRAESFDRAKGHASDRNRFRARLRWGLEKELSDDWLVGVRWATGPKSTNDSLANEPTSTNQTFDNKFNLKDIWLERAYARYTPSFLKGVGPIRKVELKAGKMELPWKGYTSSNIWDGDVTPEGLVEKIDIGLLEDRGRLKDLSLTGMFGQFILEEVSSGTGDQELYSYTGALTAKFDVGLDKPARFRSAFNFYDYVDLQDNIAIGATNRALGNTPSGTTNALALDDWNIIETYNEVLFPKSWVLGKDLKLFFDWAHNTAGRVTNGDTVTNVDERDAYSLGVILGKAKKKGMWEVGYRWFRTEANSVPGIFTDDDFGTGGTDHRGSKFLFAYSLTDYLKLKFTAFVIDDISDDVGSGRVNRFRTDLIWNF